VGSTITGAPHVLELHFSEKIDPAASDVKVFDAANHPIDKCNCHQTKRATDSLVINLPPLKPGKYQVKWRVTAIDSHVSNGSFQFQVR
jgi:methionine-rich copper-binding protein CopC